MPVKPVGPAKITDWPRYNAALKQRGCISLMLDVEMEPETTGKKGRPFIYSDPWVEAILLVGLTLRLPLRQLTGFMEDWLRSVGFELPVPSPATLCERRQAMSEARRTRFQGRAIKLADALRSGKGAVICVDSTGLSIRGAGSWRATRPWQQKEIKKRRVFMKLHVAMDPRTRKVVAYLPTSARRADSSAVKPLLEATGPPRTVATLIADGAYDAAPVYKALDDHCAREARIPPKQGARPWRITKPGAYLRNNNLVMGTKDKDFVPGGRAWRRHTRYGVRSMVENTFSRLHALSGNRLRCRSESGRLTETHLLLELLNRHAEIGLPTRRHQVFP
jgi:transposase